MGTKKMRIRINQNGQTEIRVECGHGDDCLVFTKAIEQALGKVEQRELTTDYQVGADITVTNRENLNELL
ncbi:conserved hypothetical protein [Gammaproteobacteria bacterium]